MLGHVVDGVDSEPASGLFDFFQCCAFVLGPLNVVIEELGIGSLLLVLLVSFVLAFKELVVGFVFLVAWNGEWWNGM